MSPHTHTLTQRCIWTLIFFHPDSVYILTLSPGSPGLPGGPEAPGGPGRPYFKRDHILPTPYINNAKQRAIFAPLTLPLPPPAPPTRKVVAHGREECMMQYGTARRAVNPFCVFFLFLICPQLNACAAALGRTPSAGRRKQLCLMTCWG